MKNGGVEGRIILKWILKISMELYGLDLSSGKERGGRFL